jgi:hypothetical protein
MGNKTKTTDNPRRRFLSLFVPPDEKKEKPEMVKMLTADGKLVEVEKSIVDAASTKQKVTNKEILDWMKNPSKDNS